MKKLVYASAMALMSLSLVSVPALRAQEASSASGGQISLPPAEYEAYQTATTQTNPTAKAAALESFLKTYPQSPVTKEVLDQLIDAYQQAGNADQELSAASRLLQVDPTNMKAIFVSVGIKTRECQGSISTSTGVSSDQQTCDDAAALAQKGLTIAKPAGVADADWKNETGAAYPVFDSTIALDDAAKKDYKDAITEYRDALMLYPAPATQSGEGLVDTLQLAEAYSKPESRDEVQAIWFYARAWDFAPAAYKTQIEPDLEYWYKRFHGGLDDLDAVKTAAQATVFPPATFKVTPAATPAQVAAKVVAETPDLTKLNLEDKEFILANGTPAVAQKLWSVLQNQVTPVPGIVTGVTSSAVTVHVTLTNRIVRDFVVNLKAPMATKDIRAVAPDNTSQETFITTNGDPDDTAKLSTLFTDDAARIRKIEIDPNATTIDMAVTQDAKDNNTPDFIVNLKKPIVGKDVPTPGFQYSLLPAAELDGTYDTYKPIPAVGAKAASAQIVLSDGFVQVLPPKRAPVRRAVRRRPER
ncbi:MAG: hypothetical protein ACRD27_03700 [Terracidiphilus sp.]